MVFDCFDAAQILFTFWSPASLVAASVVANGVFSEALKLTESIPTGYSPHPAPLPWAAYDW